MKYRIKKITEYSFYYGTDRTLYYPQRSRFGIWCYFLNHREENRTNIMFSKEDDAWKWIDQHRGALETKVEYIYDRKSI